MCKEDDCSKPASTAGMCQMHYMRWYRSQKNEECDTDACVRSVYSRGLCETHYKNLLREENPDYDAAQRALKAPGSPSYQRKLERKREKNKLRNPYGFKKEIVSYASAHRRLWRLRGKAKDFECVDCPAKAEHWSLSKNAKNILWGDDDHGSVLAYSLDMGDYFPRCAQCHRFYDALFVRENRRVSGPPS